MTFSLFGDKFTRHSGITRLMEDLNDGLRTPGAIMLGGGNPAQIPEMKQVEIPVLERAIKPRISVIEHDGTKVVTLDKEGMARLIDLYQHDGYATTTANNAVEVARAAITERNRLLALAKAEELEGNRLRAELHDIKESTKDERFWNSVELNATRALLALALLAGI